MTVATCQNKCCQNFSAKICPVSTPAVAVYRPSAEGIKTSKCLDKGLCECSWNHWQSKPLGLGLIPDVYTELMIWKDGLVQYFVVPDVVPCQTFNTKSSTQSNRGIISNEEGYSTSLTCATKVQLIWTLTQNILNSTTHIQWDSNTDKRQKLWQWPFYCGE